MADIEIYKQAELALKNAQGIYLDHETRVARAMAVIDATLEEARKGMTDDLYNNIGALIKKINTTIESFKETRAPITTAAQALVKAFTSQENILDVKNATTKVYQLKAMMDDYADKKEKEKALREREEKMRVEREREENSFRISAWAFLEKACNDHFFKIKNSIMEYENSVSLDNYDVIYDKIKELNPELSDRSLLTFSYETKTLYMSLEQKSWIFESLIGSDEWKSTKEKLYEDINIFIVEKLQELPSIKRELEDLALANKSQQESIMREKRLREEEAKLAFEQEKLKAQSDLQEQEKLKQTQQSIQSAFEFGSAQADLETGIKSKKVFEVTVEYPAGLLEICNFWITHQKWPMEEAKILPVTIDRMIRFAEKQATEEQIKSRYVTYTEKAVSKI